MATIQLGTTKSASKLCNYAEKRAVVKDGYNVDVDYAKSQMRMTRDMYSKNDGIQAHHVIQSFKPDEVTPEKANEIGLELAEKIAKGHEVAVYTHADTDHVHNHIVINAVNFETGKKFRAHGKEAIESTRSKSDEICKNHGLSVVKEHNASVRHTLAEQHLLEKDKPSWKEELRKAIELSRDSTNDLHSLKTHLKDTYDVEMKLRGKTISFKHPERERFIRGSKLGYDYEKEGLESEFTRQAERKQEHERTVSRNEGTQQIDGKLYSGADERGYGERGHDSQSIEPNTEKVGQSHEQHAINLEQARIAVKSKRGKFARDFDRWTRGDTREQRQGNKSNSRTRGIEQGKTQSNQQKHANEHDRNQERYQERSQPRKKRDQGLSL